MTKFRTVYVTLGVTLLLAGVGVGMNARAGAAGPRALQAGATASGQGNIAGRVNFSGKPPQLRPIVIKGRSSEALME